MAKRVKLTNNSDETDLSSLLSGDNIYQIPYFQRPYKWKKARLDQLQKDILNIVDDSSDSHFLGAVIIHGRRSNPADPNFFEVIDGQQRITTIFLYILATIKTLAKNNLYDEAVALFQKYISLGRTVQGASNIKLHPCKEDRRQLNRVMADLLSDKTLKDRLGSYVPALLPDTGKDSGALKSNYASACRFMADQVRQGELDRLRAVYSVMLEAISVVQIDVWDPTNGPIIFDSLNSRQEPMTIGDLVRNEIFARVSKKSPDVIEQVDEHRWQPFYKRFQHGNKNYFDSYFFPFGLIHDPNVSKSGVFDMLRKRWSQMGSPEEIIEELAEYQSAFLDIKCRTNHLSLDKKLHHALLDLINSNIPTSVYPFLMKLLNQLKLEKIPNEEGILIISVVKNFLVRRALCGIEPTGLHAVFKNLWQDAKSITAMNIEDAIKQHRTVTWPSNGMVKDSILNRPMYKSGISKYFIKSYDRSLGGDTPSDIPWVEHVLPQNPGKNSDWMEKFDLSTIKEDFPHLRGRKQLADLVANLIPLSGEMNGGLSNKSYEKKRLAFLNDSMFKSARMFAKEYENWNLEELKKRSEILADWTISNWPESVAK